MRRMEENEAYPDPNPFGNVAASPLRTLDVNTVRELALRWFPNLTKFPKREAHRAMSDSLESIDELKYYQTNIFKPFHEN